MSESGKEVGGVRVVAGAEVGHHAMTATLECIVDDVQELLDGLVPEEKEKEKGVETDVEEMGTEEAEEVRRQRSRGRRVQGQRRMETERWRWRRH